MLKRRRDRPPREGRGITPGRVVAWIAGAVVAWLALSLVLFMVSAALEDGVSERTEQALSGGGNFLSGSNDPRARLRRAQGRLDRRVPGRRPRAPTRSCSCTPAFGGVRKLSIPRDAEAEIPGHGTQKINAGYALGGPALTIHTVESYLGNGLKINHVIEVDFENFPEFIDALGGIDREQQDADLLAGVRQLLERLQPPQGRAQAQRPAGARLRPRTQEPLRARRERPRPRRAPAGGAQRHPPPLLSPGASCACRWISWRAPKTISPTSAAPGCWRWPPTWPPAGSGEDPIVLEPSCLDCGAGGSLRCRRAPARTRSSASWTASRRRKRRTSSSSSTRTSSPSWSPFESFESDDDDDESFEDEPSRSSSPTAPAPFFLP